MQIEEGEAPGSRASVQMPCIQVAVVTWRIKLTARPLISACWCCLCNPFENTGSIRGTREWKKESEQVSKME